MISSSKKNVQLIVQLSVELGLRHVVVSPGSRNAALIIAFNQHPDIECIVIPDERSAAFFALGMALQTDKLVGLLCTSGSAPLNYYPAISEAYYQRIPLLVYTADRPKELINQGDGQTIVQHEVYKNHINYNFTLDDTETDELLLRAEVSKAFHFASQESKGPVHLNIGFNEPLYGQEEINAPTQKLAIEIPKTKTELNEGQLTEIKSIWAKSQKKMIICGQMTPNPKLLQELKLLARDNSVTILVENTSNLVDSKFIHCIDRTINSITSDDDTYKPDLLIYLGGAIVSKKIKAFLRTNKATHHWKVGLDFPEMDTFQHKTASFAVPEGNFIQHINRFGIESQSSFGVKWKQLDYQIQEKAKLYFENKNELSDINVFNLLLDAIPENSNLHLANSSVIRYSLLFDPIASIFYYCNRGTSGIDGSTSTAAGHAFMQKNKWNTLISGDMSFFYDSNAFWNHLLTPNLRIFLINNGGGSIFKIIPGPDSTQELNDFFVFPNTFNAEHLCKNFNINYLKANSIQEIDQQLETFYTFEEDGKPKVMEIFTSSVENEAILKDYFKKIVV